MAAGFFNRSQTAFHWEVRRHLRTCTHADGLDCHPILPNICGEGKRDKTVRTSA